MPKQFITEKDVEDLAKRGIFSLEVNDDVVLTDLAYEKANRLGLRLVRDKPENPPGAPVRPYLAEKQPATTRTVAPPAGQAGQSDLRERIRSAVVARLGSQVDAHLLDVIISRVLDSTGVK